jgi:perosamine synthetase
MGDLLTIPQTRPTIGDEELEQLRGVIGDTWLTEGPRSAAFSERLNALTGSPYGVFAPNGTLALVLGLLALEIGPGDEVIVPDTTFIGSANAVVMVGATPVLVDVDAEHYCICPERAAAAITERTRAIMPVHMFGGCADMTAIMALADRHGLLVIEDAAQALGVTWNDRPAGSIGDVGCFSFFADKTITTGEGGYVTCRDAAVYERLRLLRNQGRFDRGSFIHPAIGYNFRITDLQAAVGLAQLDRLDELVAGKTRVLTRYRDGLADLEQVRILGPMPGSSYVPFRTVLIGDRIEAMGKHLEAAGVQIRSFFYPLHRQPCFREAPERVGGLERLDDTLFPNAIHGFDHGLCLPVFPTLTDSEVDHIVDAIRQFYRA